MEQPTNDTPDQLIDQAPDPMQDVAGEEPVLSIDEIEAQADLERSEAGLPTLDEAMNTPVSTEPDIYGPLRNRFETPTFNWDGFLNDLMGVGSSAIYGLGSGVKELGQTGIELQQAGIGPAGQAHAVSQWLLRGVFQLDDVADQRDAQLQQFHDAIPNIAEVLGVPKPDSTLENVVATITPMVASYMIGGKALEGLGIVSKMSALEIPGVIGSGLARVGLTGSRVGRGLLEMLKDASASGGTVFDEDTGNFAEMLKGFTGRKDMLGSVSRAWLDYVPGVEALIKDANDSPIEKRFKNTLDTVYGTLGGLFTYVAARNAKIGLQASKGLVESHILNGAAKDQQLMQEIIEKLGKDTTNETALRWTMGQFDDVEQPIVKNADGSYSAGVTKNEVVDEAAEESVALTDDAITGDRPLTPEPQQPAPLKSWTEEPWRKQLEILAGGSPEDTLKRIKEAKDAEIAAHKAELAGLRDYTNRYNTLIKRAGEVTDRKFFDSEGYLKHVSGGGSFEDWASFVDRADGTPALLTPKQVASFKDTPMDVTGNIIDNVKRLTTTNPKRKDEAIKFLAKVMGDADDANLKDAAKQLLNNAGQATAAVDNAAKIMVSNSVFLENSVKPSLNTAVQVLRNSPGDASAERMALDLLKTSNSFVEANKNLRSAFGRGLQATQIDPKLERTIQQIYGPENYRNFFNPLGKKVEPVIEEVVEEATKLSDEPITTAERAQLDLLNRYWDTIDDSAKIEWASSIHHVGQHPVWKRLGQASNFAFETLESLLMSATLFHPSTWARVGQGSIAGVLYDSAAQGVFAGKTLGENSKKILQFGALYRAISLPYSMLVAGRSFVKPGLQDVYNLGKNLYQHDPIFGYETIAKSFGDDVAAKWWTLAGGIPSRTLRAVGMGLGLPHHILGSFETMINHGALSSRVAEALYGGALERGHTNPLKFVFDNLPDVMEDAIVSNRVGKGQVALRNKVGLDVDSLRNLVSSADQNASYTSLRERGMQPGSELATTKLGDTNIFKAERNVSKFLNNLPIVGPAARGALAPFTNVSANMISRMLSPAQVILDGASRLLTHKSGPSEYIGEALSGLHGPHRQAQLLGHTAFAGTLWSLGVANMYYLRSQDKAPNYPLGNQATIEAGGERGVRYGETLLPDGGSLTTMGFNPYVTPYNLGNYTEWIRGAYGPEIFNLTNSSPEAIEGRMHVGQLAQVAAPLAPLYQGLGEIFGSLNSNSESKDPIASALTGVASGIGNMLERPMRIPDLLPGKQVAGKSSVINSAGVSTGFRTALGGPGSEAQRFRVNAYNMHGEHLPDKYDPDNSTNQYLEAFGFPSYRIPDETPLSRFMGEAESHGITFDKAPNKMNLTIGGNLEPVQVNLQIFFNGKEHLWDVYNRFISEEKVTKAWAVPGASDSSKLLSVKEALNLLAESTDDKSRIIRFGGDRKRVLSDARDRMTVLLAEARNNAKSRLETYLIEHASEFTNNEGQTLPEYANMVYNSVRPPSYIPKQMETPNQ